MSNPAYASAAPEPLSARNFARLAAVIHASSGIKMPTSKQTMLEGRLRRRVAALGLANLNAYCDYLFEGDDYEAELVYLINVATTNKTDFFREPAHFNFMAQTALPAFAEEGRRQVKIWSAAASTGAEAYTLAMVMEEFRRTERGVDYSILATDICTDVLAQAAAARFPVAMIDPVPTELRRRYILQARDPAADEVRIAPALRAKIAFARLNLMDERYPVGRDFDFVFCRNVLIYFDKPTQERVLRRLCDHIRPGGYLVLGHSESAIGVDLPVVAIVNTIFQKV
jgi:chemotaxis protein methyltransferase CheR